MNRKKLYIVLILILIGLAGARQLNVFTAEEVRRGDHPMEEAGQWADRVAFSVNEEEILVTVDGKRMALQGNQIIYMGEDKEIMLPVDALPDVFSCAANVYDGGRLVIEKGQTTAELTMGEDKLWVNQFPITLESGLESRDGLFYVSAAVPEKALGYEAKWFPEDGRLTFAGQTQESRYLPYYYDYRQKGRVPVPRNQGTAGTCWAFASLQAIETALLPEESVVLSPDHMSIHNSFGLTQDDGGEYTMSMAYLLAWQGPVTEEEDPYGDGISPEDIKPVKHVQEIQILPSKDYEKIKRAVFLHGGVQSSLYTSLQNDEDRLAYYNKEYSAYCYIGTQKPNHDIVIIGWDDNYPKENFTTSLEGDGAFICANSWGEDFGDDGYFYVSYYDTNIGIHNVVYTGIESPDNYDSVYQSDLCGWVGQLGYGKESAYFANVYEAKEAETLKAAGFYATGDGTEYEVYVAENVAGPEDFENRIKVAEGKVENAGYYTVPFDQKFDLEQGSRFAVIVKIMTPGSIHPVAIEYNTQEKTGSVILEDGEGYISYKGSSWERTEVAQKCNICLKAYTVSR